MSQPAMHAMPSPALIIDSLMGYQVSSVLKAAIEMDVFTKIADGQNVASTLAEACEASEKGTRVLCDFLTVRGFLTKAGDRYGLTADSDAFLSKNSKTYLGSVSFFLASNEIKEGFADVAAIVRKGGTVKKVDSLEPENPIWVEFARSMTPMMMLPASLMAGILSQEPVTKILDIAASHGVFGILLALQNPTANLAALDWANVLELTKENAQKFGLADRFEAIPGSAFDVEFGTDYDLILLPNFLHHFSPKTNVGLLQKIKDSLKPGGRVAICEFVPNDDEVPPPFPAMFSMTMLGTTPEGKAYTEREFRTMISNAGLEFVGRTDLLPSPASLIVARRSS